MPRTLPPLHTQRLDLLGNHLLVPFSGKKFRTPRVLWVNWRWFGEQGREVWRADVRRDVIEWLLEECCFGRPRGVDVDEPEDFYSCEQRTLYADRYGAPGGSRTHGGSGRCCVTGPVNIKGIGPTPLVDESADWYHAHGCMWLEEAVREAVIGEVAAAEFPHGAIPAIAIISPTPRLRRDDGTFEEARALLVRPNFIRLAHFERSIYFGDAGRIDSHQYQDALRTQEAISQMSRHQAGDIDLGVKSKSLRETFANIARQVGFGWAHRLWHGGYFTSSLTIDGELVDFGSFRALPTWKAAAAIPSVSPFGGEMHLVAQAVRSLSFYYERHGRAENGIRDIPAYVGHLSELAKLQFDIECAKAFSIEDPTTDAARELLSVLSECWRRQQAEGANYLAGGARSDRHPLMQGLHNDSVHSSSDDWREVISKIQNILGHVAATSVNPSGTLAGMRASAARWIRPRRLLFREKLQQVIGGYIRTSSHGEADDQGACARLIQSVIARSRRIWPHVPLHFMIIWQASDWGSNALLCECFRTRKRELWLTGMMIGDSVWLFGQRVEVSCLRSSKNVTVTVGQKQVSLILRNQRLTDKQPQRISVAGADIWLPPPDLRYAHFT